MAEIKKDPSLYDSGSKAVYGMIASIPDEAIVEDFIVHYMDKVYKLKWSESFIMNNCQINNKIIFFEAQESHVLTPHSMI